MDVIERYECAIVREETNKKLQESASDSSTRCGILTESLNKVGERDKKELMRVGYQHLVISKMRNTRKERSQKVPKEENGWDPSSGLHDIRSIIDLVYNATSR